MLVTSRTDFCFVFTSVYFRCVIIIMIIILIIIMKNFNIGSVPMVTMVQSATNWRNTHTHSRVDPLYFWFTDLPPTGMKIKITIN